MQSIGGRLGRFSEGWIVCDIDLHAVANVSTVSKSPTVYLGWRVETIVLSSQISTTGVPITEKWLRVPCWKYVWMLCVAVCVWQIVCIWCDHTCTCAIVFVRCHLLYCRIGWWKSMLNMKRIWRRKKKQLTKLFYGSYSFHTWKPGMCNMLIALVSFLLGVINATSACCTCVTKVYQWMFFSTGKSESFADKMHSIHQICKWKFPSETTCTFLKYTLKHFKPSTKEKLSLMFWRCVYTVCGMPVFSVLVIYYTEDCYQYQRSRPSSTFPGTICWSSLWSFYQPNLLRSLWSTQTISSVCRMDRCSAPLWLTSCSRKGMTLKLPTFVLLATDVELVISTDYLSCRGADLTTSFSPVLYSQWAHALA